MSRRREVESESACCRCGDGVHADMATERFAEIISIIVYKDPAGNLMLLVYCYNTVY